MSNRVPTSIFIEKNILGDITTINKFGSNASVGTSFTVISQGGIIDHRTVASTVEAISGNAADTLAGLGARKIIVQGLDSSFNEVQEEINMNGTVATTATTTSFIRIYRAWVSEVGTYTGANYADITIRVSGGGANLLTIGGVGTVGTSAYGLGQTTTTAYASALGKDYYIHTLHIDIDGNKAADLVLYKREQLDNTTTNIHSKRVLWDAFGVSGDLQIQFKNPLKIPEKTDIWVEGRVASGTGGVSVNFDIEIVVNDPEL